MKRVYKALVVGEITPLSGAEIFRGKRPLWWEHVLTLPQVLSFAAANQNQMINHKSAFKLLIVTPSDTGDGGKTQMREVSYLLVLCFVGWWCCFIRLPGDLFYYSYPPLPTAVKFPGIKLLCCQYKAKHPRLWTLDVRTNTVLQTLTSSCFEFYFFHIAIVLDIIRQPSDIVRWSDDVL